jgi:hypothetical protein
MAKKFFGTIDVLGKSLKVNNKQDYIITGVLKTCRKTFRSNSTGWLRSKSMKTTIPGCSIGAVTA